MLLIEKRRLCAAARRSTAAGLLVSAGLSMFACGGSGSKGPGPEVDEGVGGNGGQGGSSGNVQTPTPPFVDRISVGRRIDKIDLLFMIDNSISMADKQEILKDAVPSLVRRFVSPACVEQDTGHVVSFDGEACPAGFRREFAPIEDIHIGVVTSALGGHGGPNNVCANPSVNSHVNDRAELLPNVREDLPTDDPAGFLHWRGVAQDDEDEFVEKFTSHVIGVGETGCGYEASLESWYRFLIDPEPPVDMTLDDSDRAVPTAINEELLAQRAAFLRPDSLVAIIMLSDEDDCSIRDGGTDWLVADATNRLALASSACDANPNDACCYSCFTSPPSGCAADTERCGEGPSNPPRWTAAEDTANIRCAEQKRRFGIDFLYPAKRYIDALTQPTVTSRSGEQVQNPLFKPAPGGMPRDPSLVFLAGIVGVPWQDIATEESLKAGSDTLVFLNAAELRSTGRWDVILGNPEASPPVPPTDPLMQVSVGPVRSGTHPITGEPLVVAGESTLGNPINGHEYFPTDDQQLACIFRLPAPITPTDCASKPVGACECTDPEAADRQSPVCFDEPGSTISTTQHWAKAYPGPRFLSVLEGFGDNSIVASICPKSLDLDTTDPNYGYNPALGAILKRLGEVLSGRCLPSELEVDDEGNVPCSVVEVISSALADAAGCGRGGRAEPSEEVAEAIREQLRESGACSDEACTGFELCTIEPLTGTDREACLFDRSATEFAPGYCYIDPAKGPDVAGGMGDACTALTPEACTNPLVDVCAANERRLLRFVGSESVPTPTPGSTTFVACSAGGDAE